MTPTAETLRAMAADLGIELSDEHLAEAAKAHARLRPELASLRSVRLGYLDSIEPPMAARWVRSGGRLPRRKVWTNDE